MTVSVSLQASAAESSGTPDPHSGSGTTAAAAAAATAGRLGLPFVRLQGRDIEPALWDVLPVTQARRCQAVAYERHAGRVHIAVAAADDPALGQRLERLCGLPVLLALAPLGDIQQVLHGAGACARLLQEQAAALPAEPAPTALPVALAPPHPAGGPPTDLPDADGAVLRWVDTLLHSALQHRASDVHLEAYDDGVEVKYRIDGVLVRALDPIGLQHHAAITSRLKVMAELDIAERRVPQDGRFKLRVQGRDIDFRLSILPGLFGEDVVIRVLDKSAITQGEQRLRLERLGLDDEVLRQLRQASRAPHGMVLITGPTGSGKTTTLYAALSELDAVAEKIITIEDPVEYRLRGIVQIPVNERKGLTFARGLRSILRHDPDRIMVGEIRDAETASIAVQAALTGHLVFTTVHANGACDVIGRFSHMDVDVHGFVSALGGVMAQRLMRLLCERCRRPAHAADGGLALDAQAFGPGPWFEAVGCEACGGTGYHGRVAIAEYLRMTPSLRQLILDGRSVADLQRAAVAQGMMPLRQGALRLARQGRTSLQEVMRVTLAD